MGGGGFNARTGREGGEIDDGSEGSKEERGEERKSKDEKVNREGKELVEFIEDKGLSIFNGSIKGDEERKFTFTGGKGNTVIDLVIDDREVKQKVERMVIGDRIDSDHHSVEVWIKGKGEKETRGERERGSRRRVWNREGCEAFRGKLRGVRIGGEGIEEEWEKIEGAMKNAVREVGREMGKKGNRNRGW